MAADYKETSVEDAQKAYDEKSEEINALPVEEQGVIKVGLASKYVAAGFSIIADEAAAVIKSAMEASEENVMVDFPSAEATEKFKKCLTSAFKLFDKDDSGSLSGDEAKSVLQALANSAVEMQRVVLKKSMAVVVKQYLDAAKGEGESEETVKKLKEAMDQAAAEEDDKLALALKLYNENKDARDEAAFKVCDTSGNGSLSLDEFVSACTPETELNGKLVDAMFPGPAGPEE